MYARFSDGRSEWHAQFAPLWLAFFWICVAPFVSLYRVGPLSSFYLEAASLMGAGVLLLSAAYRGLLNVRLPLATFALLVLAAFWWLQARLMHLTYPGMNDMVVGTFVILALAAWACRGWVAEHGQERVAAVFAWALLIGALIQAVVAFLQFKGWADAAWLRGIVSPSGSNNVNGQLGQRNHLGHYLMWGIAAAAYLWSVRRIPAWAGALLLLTLSAVLGLVNSRTILTYVMGIGLLLPLWRLKAGRDANRSVLIFFAAIVAVAVCQFATGPILNLLGNSGYETAVERAGNSGFEGSMRQLEWRKAWIAFQNAPLFGHGWNSFALQTFLIHAEQQYFANNILGVLFTHSHNIVMQLLAETGLVGTLLVFGTLAASVWRFFRRPHHPASLMLLAMMTVSLCHSMLEYPLWYIYFLVPFVMMAALTPARYEDSVEQTQQARWRNYAGGAAALVIIAALLRLGWSYGGLIEYSRQGKTDTAAETGRRIEGLRRIAAEEPMLRYYAELSLSRRADPTDAQIKPWAQQAALDALTYRPYASAHQVALYRYRAGETEKAAKWMQAMYYYYPYMMPFYAKKIRSRPEFAPLLPTLLDNCRVFIQDPKHKTAKPCPH